MKTRILAVIVLTVIIAACLADTAPAAPSASAIGFTNPVAWGLKSQQWTYFWIRPSASGAWARVQVLSDRGVVADIYDGPLAKRTQNPAGTYWFPAWNGRNTGSGRYLPADHYTYRVTLNQGGQTSTYYLVGSLLVCRNHFTLSTDRPAAFKRYLYADPTTVSIVCTYGGGAHRAQIMAGVYLEGVVWEMNGGEPLTLPTTVGLYSSSARFHPGVSHDMGFDLFATSLLNPPSRAQAVPIDGTFSLTFTQ